MLNLNFFLQIVLVFAAAAAHTQRCGTFCSLSWNGWAHVEKIYSGDSYSTTRFDINGVQPNSGNPFGNPAYPGETSSNASNYVDYLTTTYNRSFIETYDLGYGGATVDRTIVPPFLDYIPDFRQRVKNDWLPNYGNQALTTWTAANSLFVMFFGINDITNTYSKQNSSINPAVIASYMTGLDELYNAGARNLLVLNVPPVDRSPGTLVQGSTVQGIEAAAIGNFNFLLQGAVRKFAAQHLDAAVFLFDTNWIFTLALNNPGSFQPTAGLRNTTDFCNAYQYGTPQPDSFDPACSVPVNQYFWLNSLHPTYPIHQAIAQRITGQLL